MADIGPASFLEQAGYRFLANAPKPVRQSILKAKRPKQDFDRLESLFSRPANEDYSVKSMTDRGIIFVHIPKCAGISVTKALMGSRGAGHTTAKTYLVWLGARTFDHLTKIGVVRNPFDRVYSTYRFLKKGGLTEADAQWAESNAEAFESFDSFVETVLKVVRKPIRHVLPMSHFTDDPRTSRSGLDVVLRFESLEDDYNALPDKLKVEKSLPKLNITGGVQEESGPVVQYKTVEIILDYYRRDFLEFGYAPESPWPVSN